MSAPTPDEGRAMNHRVNAPWHVRPLVRRPRALVMAFLVLGTMAVAFARAGSVVPSQAPVVLVLAVLWPSLLRFTSKGARTRLAILGGYVVFFCLWFSPWFNTMVPKLAPLIAVPEYRELFGPYHRHADLSMHGAGTWTWLVLLLCWSLAVVWLRVHDHAVEAERWPATSSTENALRVAGVWLALTGTLALADGLRDAEPVNELRSWNLDDPREDLCRRWYMDCASARIPESGCTEEANPWCWTDGPTSWARAGAGLGALGMAVGLGSLALGMIAASRRRHWLRMVAGGRVPGWLLVPERNFAPPINDETDGDDDESAVPRERLALVFDVDAAAAYRAPHRSGLVGWVAKESMEPGRHHALADFYPCIRLVAMGAWIVIGTGWTYQISKFLIGGFAMWIYIVWLTP